MRGFPPVPFMTDLARDLRDRRLLPLIVVLAAAVVAVPLALSNSSSPPPAASGATPGAVTASSSGAPVVVVDNHGLRDYARRLGADGAKNPFTPHFTGVPQAATLKPPSGTIQTPSTSTGSPGSPSTPNPS